MNKSYQLSFILIAGVVLSQFLPFYTGTSYAFVSHVIKVLSLAGFAFVMIFVGYEFQPEKLKFNYYGYDYFVSTLATIFPWFFTAAYFAIAISGGDLSDTNLWKRSLLAAKFAAPTSAGLLFAMMAAEGLSKTWVFKKARYLVLFDDLNTILFMIPLKILIIGFNWKFMLILLILLTFLLIAALFNGKINLPAGVRWFVMYALIITGISEMVYLFSYFSDDTGSIYIEVLIPAFVLGTVLSKKQKKQLTGTQQEYKKFLMPFGIIVFFMFFAGLSMPVIPYLYENIDQTVYAHSQNELVKAYILENPYPSLQPNPYQQPFSLPQLLFHVLIVTLVSNIGKMVVFFFYRRNAHWKHRLALAFAMFPRGAIGTGILIVTLSYGMGGNMILVAMVSMAVNILLSGVFIHVVKKLGGRNEL